MTNHKFEIWLAVNRYTQRQLAIELGVTPDTITNWKRNEHYPRWFVLALRGLENKGV